MDSLRDQILTFDDIETVEMYVPEWGCAVWVRGLTGLERDKFEVGHAKHKEAGTVRAFMTVLACRDSEGNRVFRDEDVYAVAAKHANALSRIYDRAIKLSGIGAKDADEIEGN